MSDLLNIIFFSDFTDGFILTTGLINMASALLLFSTCRFIPHSRSTSGWMDYSWYKILYKYHSYVWWLFIPSLTLHVVFTVTHILLGG